MLEMEVNMNKFEICVGDNIELIESDEFFFDKFNPGDVFKITNIKENFDDRIIAISSVNDCSVIYYLSENTIQQYFKPCVVSKTDNNETYTKESKRIIKIDTSFAIDVLNGARIKVFNVFNKCTIVAVRLVNGFVIVESSNCFDPECFDNNIGIDICMDKIISKVLEYEAYAQYDFADETVGFKNAFISGNDGARLQCSLNDDIIECEFDIEDAMKE